MARPAAVKRNKPEGQAVAGDVRLINLLATLVVLGALALIAGAGWAAVKRSPALALRTIRVEGELVKTNVAALRAYAAPKVADNFLNLDLAKARAVFESAPWVRRASVKRIWPDTIEVRIEEHRAVAFWDDGDGQGKLVNEYGEVFDANLGEVDEVLPRLRGPEGTAARLLVMHGKLAALFEPTGTRLAGLRLSRRGSWQATLDDGAVVELGRGGDGETTFGEADMLDRAARFVRTLGDVRSSFAGAALRHADLRHVNGYALRLDGVATAETPLQATPKNGTKR